LQYPRARTGSAYTVPATVTNIGPGAFFACGLSSVLIPAAVTAIAFDALNGCGSLTNIAVDLGNSAYSSVAGILFDRNQTSIIAFPAGLGGAYLVPALVTNIATDAFASCTRLTKVIISPGLASVGNWAFQECSHLTNCTLPGVVVSIGDGAFANCQVLSNLSLPDSITNLGQWAFKECPALTRMTIGNNVSCISTGAFYFCTGLTNVTISASVTNIQPQAFLNCSSLTSIYCLGNAPMTNATPMFYSATNTIVYYLPGTVGWGAMYNGCPTMLWNPQAQTGDGNFGVQTNRFGFNITGTTNIPIVVEACTNFVGAWAALQSVSLTNGSCYFSDPQWTNYPRRFYHIRSP